MNNSRCIRSNKSGLPCLMWLLLLVCALLPGIAWASPAQGGSTLLTQPDGSTLTAYLKGDESFHGVTDGKDHLLLQNEAKTWVYLIQKGSAYAYGAPAGKAAPANAVTFGAISGSTAERVRYRAFAASGTQAAPDLSKVTLFTGGGIAIRQILPTGMEDTGIPVLPRMESRVLGDPSASIATRYGTTIRDTIPLLVIRVEFAETNDATSSKFPENYWADLLFGEGRSLSAYYDEVSGRQFTYIPASESCGSANDGIVSVTMPFAHPGMQDTAVTMQGVDGNTYELPNITYLAGYAMLGADQYIDYAQYDANQDGVIDPQELAITCIVSGLEQSAGKPTKEDSVWAHSWQINNGRNYLTLSTNDNVALYKYTMGGENLNFQDPSNAISLQVGTLAHELGHDLGLPDLYNTLSGSGKQTQRNVLGESLMACGGWGAASGNEIGGSCPTHFDAWCKVQLGFAEEVTAQNGQVYTLYPASASEKYQVLKIPTADEAIYYLLENRQLDGFDAGMRGIIAGGQMLGDGGLILWRVNNGIVSECHSANTINAYRDDGDYGVMSLATDDADLSKFREPTGVIFDEDSIRITAEAMNGCIRVKVENGHDTSSTPTTTTAPTGETTLTALTLSKGANGYTVTLTGENMPDETAYCCAAIENEYVTESWGTVALTGGNTQKTGSIAFPATGESTQYTLIAFFDSVPAQDAWTNVTVEADGTVTGGLTEPDDDGGGTAETATGQSLLYTVTVSKGSGESYEITLYGHNMPGESAAFALMDQNNQLVQGAWASGTLTGDGAQKTGTLTIPKGNAGTYFVYAYMEALPTEGASAMFTVDAAGTITEGLYDKAGNAPLCYRLFVSEPDERDALNVYTLTLLGKNLPAQDASTSIMYLTDPNDVSTAQPVMQAWAMVALTGDAEKKTDTLALPEGTAGGYGIYAGYTDASINAAFAFVIADAQGVVTSGLAEPPALGDTTAQPTPTPSTEATATPAPQATPQPSSVPTATPRVYTLFGGSVPAGASGGSQSDTVESVPLWPYLAAGLALAAAILLLRRGRRKAEDPIKKEKNDQR